MGEMADQFVDDMINGAGQAYMDDEDGSRLRSLRRKKSMSKKYQPTLTAAEVGMIRDSLASRMNTLETGQAHLGMNDVANWEPEMRERHGIQTPTREQFKEAMQVRRLYERFAKVAPPPLDDNIPF